MATKASQQRIRKFFSQVHQNAVLEAPMESRHFDGQAMLAFEWLVQHHPEQGGAQFVSMRELSKALHVHRDTMRRRMQLLARYAMVKVEAVGSGTGLARYCSRITVNPAVISVLTGAANVDGRSLAKAMAQVGLFRGDSATQELQGFNSHVDFGACEPTLLPGMKLDTDVRSELFDLAIAQSAAIPAMDAKRAKEAERAERNARHAKWVECCGKLWTKAQISHGRMKATDPLPPAWAVATKGVHKKERDELTQLLEQYGGQRTAMAWMMFNQAEAELKDNKPVFRLDLPFVQYVSVDKKPTQFAKHFSAMIANAAFQRQELNPERQAKARLYFGELFDYSPARSAASTHVDMAAGPDRTVGVAIQDGRVVATAQVASPAWVHQ